MMSVLRHVEVKDYAPMRPQTQDEFEGIAMKEAIEWHSLVKRLRWSLEVDLVERRTRETLYRSKHTWRANSASGPLR